MTDSVGLLIVMLRIEVGWVTQSGEVSSNALSLQHSLLEFFWEWGWEWGEELWGHIWQCSEITPDSALRSYLAGLGELCEMLGTELGSAMCVRQIDAFPTLLRTRSSGPLFEFLKWWHLLLFIFLRNTIWRPMCNPRHTFLWAQLGLIPEYSRVWLQTKTIAHLPTSSKAKTLWKDRSFLNTYFLIQVTALLDGLDPGQHIISVFSLK